MIRLDCPLKSTIPGGQEVGEIGDKASTAQLGLEAGTGAELGKID